MPSGFPSSHERQASLNLLPVAPSYLVTLGKKAFSSSCHGDLELSPAVTEAEGAAGCRLPGRGSPPAQAGPRRPLRHRAATPNSLWGVAGPPAPPLAAGFGLPASAMLETRPHRVPPREPEPQRAAAACARQPRWLRMPGSPPCFLFQVSPQGRSHRHGLTNVCVWRIGIKGNSEIRLTRTQGDV